MTENLPQSLQQLVQDVIAPDVRELKVRLASLEKQMDVRFAGVDRQFESVDHRFESLEQKMEIRFAALDQKSDAQFKALMAAIAESKAQAELTNMQVIAALSERVAVLEAQRQ